MKTYEDSAVKARASLSIVNIGQGGIIALGLFLVMGMAGEDIAKGICLLEILWLLILFCYNYIYH